MNEMILPLTTPDLIRQDGFYNQFVEHFEVFPDGKILYMVKDEYFKCRHTSRGFRKMIYEDIDTEDKHIKTEYVCLKCKRKMNV
jgi:hypothetical protein